MTPESVITVGQQAMLTISLVSAPLLISALAVGLIVGMFQAATQIQDMTLSFIPKLIVLVIAISIAGPWMLQTTMTFMLNIFLSIPDAIG
ncbi:MAG: flagellar biosynthesis protein FliQ [Pseudomonadales bacterium]|nr:flagellar biosynthesis protein FliQ [Pseudomonadales bacterium]